MGEFSLSLDDRILVALRRVIQSVERYSSYLWQNYGLSAPQLGALRELMRCEQASPGQLAKALHLGPPTVAGILKRLEQRELITRLRDPQDRRNHVIRITAQGCELAAGAPSLLRDEFRSQLNRLGVADRTRLAETLERVAVMMSSEVDESAQGLEPGAATGEPEVEAGVWVGVEEAAVGVAEAGADEPEGEARAMPDLSVVRGGRFSYGWEQTRRVVEQTREAIRESRAMLDNLRSINSHQRADAVG